jgi:hypothetical protein
MGEEGGTPDDPYADVDVDRLPAWWREAVREFEAHGLGPYRPPRFADGVVTPPVVERLAAAHGVSVDLVSPGPDDWGVYVDGDRVASVGHERDPAGFSRFAVTSAAFAALVASGVRS